MGPDHAADMDAGEAHAKGKFKMTAPESIDDKYTKVFFPHAEKRIEAMKASGGRFVYYTTADVATSILVNRQVWMRNATAMNDFMEIAHGLACLDYAYARGVGKLFESLLDSCHPGLAAEVNSTFTSWRPGLQLNTYLICVSEHGSSEDLHGRLSMWRAYGGDNGVALVMNSTAMLQVSDVLGAYSSPVSYLDSARFTEHFREVVIGMKAEADYIKSLPRNIVQRAAFNMLRFATLCTKHPAFHEECEWRVVASPSLHPANRLTPSVEIVRGVPQVVQKLDLKNDPGSGLIGLELPELLERIIIGPCEFPFVVYDALHNLLKEAGITNPGGKIVVSDIPLRRL